MPDIGTLHQAAFLPLPRGAGAGAGNAGSVIVEAPRVALTGGARIESFTFGPGQGGTVRVTATDTLTLAGTTPDGASRAAFWPGLGTWRGRGTRAA